MRKKFSVISDLDGVLHRASRVIPGAPRFVRDLQNSGRPYLFLTNSPDHSPQELHRIHYRMGINIPPDHFYTAAQAIGTFLVCHARCPRVYMVGSKALRAELLDRGIQLTEKKPEFVVFGTAGPYGTKVIDRAIDFVMQGAKLVTAAHDPVSLTEDGIHAGCGALVSPIEKATGQKAYVVGKPNHFMIRQAETHWGITPLEALMIGDSLETDVEVGLQAQMKTVLVLSGCASRKDLKESPYKPDFVFQSVADIRLDKLP